jgi:hypothetical protein
MPRQPLLGTVFIFGMLLISVTTRSSAHSLQRYPLRWEEGKGLAACGIVRTDRKGMATGFFAIFSVLT